MLKNISTTALPGHISKLQIEQKIFAFIPRRWEDTPKSVPRDCILFSKSISH